jgi:hypothetical protein
MAAADEDQNSQESDTPASFPVLGMVLVLVHFYHCTPCQPPRPSDFIQNGHSMSLGIGALVFAMNSGPRCATRSRRRTGVGGSGGVHSGAHAPLTPPGGTADPRPATLA